MEEIVLNIGIAYIVILIIIWVLFKRMLYSILDPAIWIVPLFSSLLALSYDKALFPYMLFSVLSFWSGMYLVNHNKITRNFNPIKTCGIEILKVFTCLVFILYTWACLITFIKGGIPLFSSNPSEAKLAVFEGIGIVRRLTFLGGILPINLAILLFSSPKNKGYIIMLGIYCLIKLLLGAKSSIVGLIFPIFYFMTQKNLIKINFNLKKYKKNLVYIGLVAVLLFVVIVSKESAGEGESLIYSIGFRLMEFGDVMLLYSYDYVQDAFPRSEYSFWTFFSEEFSGILGMLRLADYKEPLGYIMVKAVMGKELDVMTGPNTPAPIRGHIYFGFLGGIMYSFIVGYIFAKIRKYFFTYKINNLFHYSVIGFIFFNLMTLVRDSPAFFSLLFDYVFYTFPLYILTLLIIRIYGRFKPI